MDFVLILLLTVLTVLFLSVGVLALCVIGYRRVRRKGYPPPSATLVLLGGGAVGILVAVVGAIRMPIEADAILFFSTFFWYPSMAAVLVSGLIIYILPRRNPRVFGPRRPRFPF